MNAPAAKSPRRRPWLAGLLSFLSFGLGNLYAGQPWVALAAPVVGLGNVLLLPLAWSRARSVPVTVFLGATAILWVLATLGPVSLARQAARSWPEGRPLAWYQRLVVYVVWWGVLAVAGAALTGAVRTRVLEPFRVASGSMAPTLLTGDWFYTFKTGESAAPRRGMIAALRLPEPDKRAEGPFSQRIHVKRIVALGGDTVELREGAVWVEGHPILPAPDVEDYGPVRVPEGSLFVLGDNLAWSRDSRHVGPVPASGYVGEVGPIYFSYSEQEGPRWSRVGVDPR